MKYPVALLALAISVSAASIPRQDPNCGCFNLIAIGLPTGSFRVVEDTIGENELNGTFQEGKYCFSQMLSYTLTDVLGNNCIFQESSQQFQCVSGVPTTTKFSLDDDYYLLSYDSPTFWACPTTRVGGGKACPTTRVGGGNAYDIFSESLANTTSCFAITMKASEFVLCTANGRPSSTAAEANCTVTTTMTLSSISQTNAVSVTPFRINGTPTLSTTPTSTHTIGCPTDLSSNAYLPPNLIVPISPDTPDTAYGTSFNAIITPYNLTLFSFDIPWSYNGVCSLIFTFPYVTASQFPYTYSGIEEEVDENGGISFGSRDGEITNSTTYNSTPQIYDNFGKIQVIPGNNYTVATFNCPSGKELAISAASVGNFALEYFQSTADWPMGLWIVPCA